MKKVYERESGGVTWGSGVAAAGWPKTIIRFFTARVAEDSTSEFEVVDLEGNELVISGSADTCLKALTS